MSTIIDEAGYRYNVGIVICNDEANLLWAKRAGIEDAWQFPQGGMHTGETSLESMYRELDEELGLQPQQVEVIAETPDWMIYDLPEKYRRYDSKPLCVGQKQKWFLLYLLVEDPAVKLDSVANPEFDRWCWVNRDIPAQQVIEFKRAVYQKMLAYFSPYLQAIQKIKQNETAKK